MLNNLSENEERRLAELEGLRHAQLGSSEVLDQITELVCDLLQVPTSLVTLLGSEHQWIPAKTNFEHSRTLKQDAFCLRTVGRRGLTVIEDALTDAQFKDNPLVTGKAGIRFYAGVPLITRDGYAIGSVCAIDYQPRRLSSKESDLLGKIGNIAVEVIEARNRVGFIESVTLLPNRQKLLKDIDWYAKSNSLGHDYSLIFISTVDIHYLYDVAGGFGIDAVEKVICDVSNALKLSMDERHTLYALSLSRFAILTPTRYRQDTLRMIGEFASRLHSHFKIKIPIRLDVNVGYYDFSPGKVDAHTAFRKALSALHYSLAAEESVFSYRAGFDEKQRTYLQLMSDLSEAIESQSGLYLEYQPKVGLNGRRIIGVEALLRWLHPEHGIIPPSTFIPLVDQTNLINPLTYWVIREAARAIKRWREKGVEIVVSVNVSVTNLIDSSFPNKIVEILESESVLPRFVEIECLETATLLENPQAIDSLHRLSALGLRIAIDDFGDGYSNLSYLQRVPANIIKIDKSLVQTMVADRANAFVVEKIIEIAHFMQFEVVAEGVENEETLSLLRNCDCDAVQGFHFYQPLGETEALDVIINNDNAIDRFSYRNYR